MKGKDMIVKMDYFELNGDINTTENREKIINIDNQLFSNLKYLGGGTFGVVFEGKCSLFHGEIVAIKFQRILEDKKKKKEEKIYKLMNKLNNLAFDILCVSYYGSLRNPDYTIIIEEKADSDLKKIIRKKIHSKEVFKNEEKKQIFENLITNLYLLHMNGIAHYDIKPANILYYEKFNKYILRDYGECEKYEGPCNLQEHQTPHFGGTEDYMSPKLYQKNLTADPENPKMQHNPFKSDIYSMGLVFLQVHLAPNKLFTSKTKKTRQENIDEKVKKQKKKKKGFF